MAAVSMMVGAPTPDGATFVAKVSGGGPVRVAVSTSADMSAPVFTSSQAVDAQGVAKVAITGLAPDTAHWWQVEDNSVLDVSTTGRFRTLPPAGVQASFTIGAAACAGSLPEFPGVAGGELDPDRVSNHPVWETIRSRAVDEDWSLYVNLGDWGYPDFGDATTDTLANRRAYYDDNLAQPNQAGLWSQIPSVYVWDDHDFGANDSDGTLATKSNAAQVYRERVPHYPLVDSSGIWQAWQIGRVQCIASDVRYYRSPNTDPQSPSKTMLGSAQKAWLEGVLSGSDAKLLIWFMASQWLGDSTDGWASFADERDELVAMLDEHGWLGRMLMVYGDHHALGITGGGTNTWGGFPILQAASVDSNHGGPVDGLFDIGPDTPGRAQYGTITVDDLGTAIAVTLIGWRDTTQLMSFKFGISLSPPSEQSAAQVREFATVVSGSHRAVFEARVLADFQTGADPDGELVSILGGTVEMDGTADIQRTLRLVTEGGQFPRRVGDLLLPDGTEIFVRRGVDIGSEIRWAPLGYFRIQEPDQGDAPQGPISIQAFDRMKGIIDSPLIAPVQFAATASFGGVFAALVLGVYPDATILFDDGLGSEQIGRPLVVERSRYEPLKTLAHGRGKILYWDGQGLLRVETAPDPAQPVWEVNAGAGGVLTQARRRITRTDVVNAVVVRSQGLDALEPARAVAIDDGSNSITRFGGRFGVVPDFITVPAETTQAQAQEAARATLLRRAGLPFQVEFTAVPNPALQPYDPVRVTLRDGSREKHVVERLSMPLTASEQMSASTREQRGSLIRVVSL